MSSALVREMSSVSGQSGGSGGRAEIRKKQNRDSARRSREKRKSHLRGVFESVEQQTRRVRELDARVAMLEALVNREVKPKGRRRAPTVPPKPRVALVEEQKVIAAPTYVSNISLEKEANASDSDIPVGLVTPPEPVFRHEVALPSEIDRAILAEMEEHDLSFGDQSQSLPVTLDFPPNSPAAALAFPLALDTVRNGGEQTESIEGTPSLNPWQSIAHPALSDPVLPDCPLDELIGDL